MSFEIERKWALAELPKECGDDNAYDIEQCYFSSGPAVRIRKDLGEKNEENN